jgi:hypothetical protein
VSDTPQPGVGAWVPDPGGRHQLRWWDGRAYTAVVADQGIRGIDPLPEAQPATPPAAPPATPTATPFAAGPPLTSTSPTAPTWTQVPVAGATPPVETAPSRGGRRKVLLVVGGVAILVVAGLVATSLAGDEVLGGDDAGLGSFDGEVSADELGHHQVSVGATQVLVATIVPDDDVDVVVGLLVDAEEAGRLEGLYGDLAGPTAPGEAFDAATDEAVEALVAGSGEGDGSQVVFRSDIGFAGEDEALLLVAGAVVDGSVVVAPFGDAAGGYTVEIERFELELDPEEAAEADGVELLEAVIASREVPSRVIDLAADLLELLEEQGEP